MNREREIIGSAEPVRQSFGDFVNLARRWLAKQSAWRLDSGLSLAVGRLLWPVVSPTSFDDLPAVRRDVYVFASATVVSTCSHGHAFDQFGRARRDATLGVSEDGPVSYRPRISAPEVHCQRGRNSLAETTRRSSFAKCAAATFVRLLRARSVLECTTPRRRTRNRDLRRS